MIVDSVHPVNAAFLRFLIASLCLLAITVRTHGRLPRLNGRQVVSVVLLGLTGVFSYNILFFNGLQHIHAGRASLIIANNPILISLLSALFFKESLNWFKAAGICTSVLGAMVVISNGQLGEFSSYTIGLGELLIFGCVASWVAYSLVGKHAMKSLSPLISVTYSSLVGTALLFPPALANGLAGNLATYSSTDWMSFLYLGFFGTVLGFFWYYQGIARIGPMKASVFINFVPISAIILASLILNEPVTISLLLGAVLVIVGVTMTNSADLVNRLSSAMKRSMLPSGPS